MASARPSSTPVAGQTLVRAWPPAAQLAAAFLAGTILALLLVNSANYWRWRSRPAELDRSWDSEYRIDLNRADRAELLQLPGVGENLADRIERYRNEHGRFNRLGDLTAVSGVGAMTIERLRPWITVQGGEGESDSTVIPSRGARSKTSPKAAKLSSPLDVNLASAQQLQQLPGVGPVMAQRIIEVRRQRAFQSIEDLRRVRGIGPKVLERLRPHITVVAEPTRVVAAAPEANRIAP